MTEEIKSTEERIARLEAHLNYQIDENRKISRRLDEIESRIESFNIRNDKFYDEMKIYLDKQDQRMDKLETLNLSTPLECDHEWRIMGDQLRITTRNCTKCGDEQRYNG